MLILSVGSHEFVAMGAGGSDCKSASCNCHEAVTGRNGEGISKYEAVTAHRTCCFQEEEVEGKEFTPDYPLGLSNIVLSTSSRGDSLPLHFKVPKDALFGLAVANVTKLIVVVNVDPEGLFVYTAKGTPGLFPGDVIQSVNGIEDPVGIRKALSQIATNGGNIDILLHTRPSIFDVTLHREGSVWNRLGISVKLDQAAKPPKMIVQHVRSEGLIPAWNEAHGAFRVCRCDCITAVNGVRKSVEEMQEALQAGKIGDILGLRIETPFREPVFYQSMLTPRRKSSVSRTFSTPSTFSSLTT